MTSTRAVKLDQFSQQWTSIQPIPLVTMIPQNPRTSIQPKLDLLWKHSTQQYIVGFKWQSGPVFLSSLIVLGNIVLHSTHYDSTMPWKDSTIPWKHSAGTLRGFSGPRLCTIHSPLPVCCIHNTNTTWTARNMHTLGENFLRISCCMSRPGLTWWC